MRSIAVRSCSVLLLGVLIAAGAAMAQVTGGGSIQGTVSDPSGAVVPQAQIVATNVATGVETVRQTTTAGFYVITPLPAGEYTVKVTAPGFQTTTQEHVMVNALATVSLSLQLKVGSSSEQVTVTASPTMLHTDDATLGGSMENNVYTSLPLAMNGVPRDPTQFVALIPGVAGMSTQVAGPTTESFNGVRGGNELYVEGIPLTFPSQQADTRNLALGVSVEAVDQFQAQTSGQKAMYSGQGMQNFVLKSGTDHFHGSVYEYFRNTDLDARGFFPATVPVEHQNEFGGTFGGPIKKGKIFFFGTYGGYYYNDKTYTIYRNKTGAAPGAGDIISKVELSMEFLLLGFDGTGDPHIVLVDGCNAPADYGDVGFCVIGSGSVAAQGALAFHVDRGSLGAHLSWADAVYCICDAKFRAESASDVGQQTFLALYEHNKEIQLISPSRVDEDSRNLGAAPTPFHHRWKKYWPTLHIAPVRSVPTRDGGDFLGKSA